jgi:hypothetical protein
MMLWILAESPFLTNNYVLTFAFLKYLIFSMVLILSINKQILLQKIEYPQRENMQKLLRRTEKISKILSYSLVYDPAIEVKCGYS